MKKVAILGANGQVGCEVALFLRQRDDIEVVPICRNRQGSAFLRHMGFSCRHGSASDPNARELFEDCSAVADFTLPTGSAVEVRRAFNAIIPPAVQAAPARAPYIYLSSITAFGFPDFRSPLRHYRFSRNSYGTLKRYAEKLVVKHCAGTSRDAFVLRVGVVHGEMQAVSRKLRQLVRDTATDPVYIPDAPSYSVFAYSIAEAVAGAALGREDPGHYTLVSEPAWSWEDLHRYYAREEGVPCRVERLPADAERSAVGSIADRFVAPLLGLVWRQKDVIAGYAGARLPGIEDVMRARYHQRNARRELALGEMRAQQRPYNNNRSVLPGRRMTCLSDSRVTMAPAAEKLRAELAAAQHARR